MTATGTDHQTDAHRVTPKNWRRSPERGRGRWLVVRLTAALLFSAITGVAAYAASDATQPPTYRATAVVVATPSANRVDNEALLRTLVALATSPPVLNAASDRGGLNMDDSELVARVNVSRPPDSALLNISIDDASRSTSLAIANSVAAALVANSARFSDDTSTTTPTSRIKIFTLGTATAQKIEPPLVRNALIGFGLGALMSGTALVVLGRREERLGSVEELAVDARDVLEVPSQHPRDAATAFDLVHKALITEDGAPLLRRIAIVGGSSKEESAFVVMLCAVLASLDRRVLLVDADLGSRTITRRLHMPDHSGLAELLTEGETTSSSAWAPLPADAMPPEIQDLLPPRSPEIHFLPAGQVDVKPGLLNHRAVAMLIEPRDGADVSVVATPRVPGPYPVTSLVQPADLIFVLEVPGWTRVNEGRWRLHLVRQLSGAAQVIVAVLGQSDPGVPTGQR